MTQRNPAEDASFEVLFERWTTLGHDKHEGLGLLWKEGYIGAFLAVLHRRAPRTMGVLAERLAEGAPEFRQDTGYIPRRLMAEFVRAMGLPFKARNEHLFQLEISGGGDLTEFLDRLEPPMESRFRSRLEAWLDLAAGIEARADGTAKPVASGALGVGSKVMHAQWGSVVITALRAGVKPLATVDFREHGVKKLLVSFLTAEETAHDPQTRHL